MEIKEKIVIFSVAKNSPKKKIKSPSPKEYIAPAACQTVLQIGIFFDGTGNNLNLHKASKSHSNVARLYETYPAEPAEGKYSIYIPGLGTPFPLVGEETERYFGGSFGDGGDSRIAFAILNVVDILHKTLFNTTMFPPPLLRALCHAKPGSIEQKFLDKLKLDTSLTDGEARSRTKNFLSVCLKNILIRMTKNTVPKICEISIDVFGFSRGATEARVFCHWIRDLLSNSTLVGIPFRFRFLGLMDTVASVGIWEGIKNDQSGSTGGHSNWATVEAMKILPEVENCLHLIAMHELRKNFPLDTVLVGGLLPSNCLEFCYPGSHSDIGGGYAPGELGVSPDDSEKLSQIPLNHMFDCAVAGGVPFSRERLGKDGQANFIIDKKLLEAYNKFIEILTEAPRTLGEWMLPYLVWRWQTRLKYHDNIQFKRSKDDEKEYLMAGNIKFCYDDDLLKTYGDYSKISMRKKRPYDRDGTQVTRLALESEASELRKIIVLEKNINPELASFFDNYVHDSVAGFRKQFVEVTGHWRYRRIFLGTEKPHAG
ncbi:DUF2235 domain-containing protein [Duganella sp. Leaf61]|uniref:T6SS phospholipase effector Tle1-like catalytic domain-containing protein n=1 Tax=Duganella sp. Leaf61 TaxID=1736227 RepID=UPI0009EB50ED|nr:DUF2235 domain-containing protein [Duganella sp. Leaf61]